MNTISPLAGKLAILVLLLITLACGTQTLPATNSPAPTLAPIEITSTPSAIAPTEFSPFPTFESTPPASGAVLHDVVYCTMDSVPLRMDIYFPTSQSGPSPVLVYVHGGGWTSGEKSEILGLRDLPMFTAAGYLVVSVDYRLAPEFHFPAMIQDVKCAVRYLRAHADEYNLDPDHIGAWGLSAGGHLVSLLGLADESAGWDVGEYLDQSSRVQAVVDMFGPADFTQAGAQSILPETMLETPDPTADLLAWLSPVTYISPDDPPFLIFHGNRDWIVPAEQAALFDQRLRAAGVPSQLVIIQNAGHGLIPMGKPLQPSAAEVIQMMFTFFAQHLKTP